MFEDLEAYWLEQGPTVELREVCSMLHGSLDGRGRWRRMGTCTCVAELIRYTPIQNKKLKKKEKRNLLLED